MAGGGSGGGTTYQTQKSESGPPLYLQPFLQEGIGALANEYRSHGAPAYYSGEVVAPLSDVTNQSITGAQNLAGNNPVLPGAIDSLKKFAAGNYVSPSSNPDFQAALAYAHQPALDQFTKQVLPGIQGTFSSAGRYGSGAQQAAVGQAVDSLNRNIAGADASAGANYYQQALQQELQANSLIPGVNQSLLANNAALAGAGNTIDVNRQAQDAAAQAAYNYNANKDMNYISQYLQMLNAGYPGGQTTSSGSAASFQPTNTAGGILGGVLGGIGMLGSLAVPGAGGISALGNIFSDARLKENIVPVGKTYEGQNLYHYNYKGDPTPHVGVMAQEVAETKPEAVAVHPSGYLTVNLPKALGLF